ncbi:MAG: hypothetical protein ABIG43_01105 [Chloroflexota bacterium]
MEKTKKHLEPLLYISIFLLGLFLRLCRVGSLPLTDYEARWAFQAFSIAQRNTVRVGSQASYVGLTSLSFYLLDSSRFIARFWPAIVGSLIVLIPYIWQEKIGKWPALILAFCLAIDPAMLVAARQTGSPIFALIGLIAGLSLLYHKKPALAGVSLALAFMGGESFWLGALIFGITWGLSVLLNIRPFSGEDQQITSTKEPSLKTGITWKGLAYFAGTLIIVGSSFFLYPAGLSGMLAGFPEFIKGFYSSSGTAFWQPLLALFTYQFLPLVLGLWAGIKAWFVKDDLGCVLIVWFLIAVIFVLIQPGRQVIDLVWAVIPLWVLTARHSVGNVKWFEESKTVQLAVILFTVVMFVFIAMNLRSLADPALQQGDALKYTIAVAAGGCLLIITIILIGLGWRFDVALHGFMIGFSVFLLVNMVSFSLSSLGTKSGQGAELWRRGRDIPLIDLMVNTIEDLSDLSIGEAHAADIVATDVNTSDLAWGLRRFENVEFITYIPVERQPMFVITELEDIPELSASYRGQDFLWYQWPAWEQMNLVDTLRWVINRQVIFYESNILLWVRGDIFLGQ